MIGRSLFLLVELLVLFFVVAFSVYLVQRRLGSERLRKWMGGSPTVSALKGITIGFITPFCTYSAIPMLIGLRQAGVPPAGYVAFMTAAPVLDPVLLGALVLIVGPAAAVLYTVVAFVAALTLALVAQRLGIEAHLKPLSLGPGALTPAISEPAAAVALAAGEDSPAPEASAALEGSMTADSALSNGNIGCDGSPYCAHEATGEEEPWRGILVEAAAAARAAVALLRSVAWILLAGLAIGALIEIFISPSDVAAITGDNGFFAIPVAAALGTPLYIDTSLFVPIADALAGAGVGVGAIVALTIAGAGANIPEFVILTKLAERRLIVVFIAYVFTVAIVGGALAHALLA